MRTPVDLTLIDALLLFAPLVVVPLAWPLAGRAVAPPRWLVTTGQAGVVAAVLVNRGGLAAAFAVLWFGVAVVAARRAVATRDLIAIAACGYMIVGAAHLVATRAGWTVAGIDEPIVELTAVHFHYAGFATTLLAGSVWRAARNPWSTAALVLAIGAPPFVAAGFTWEWAFPQIAGAIFLASAAWLLAAVTVTCIVPGAPRASARLLCVSAAAVVAPMVLAVAWASAQYYDVRALSIPDMARVHGTLNALGFVLCGVGGHRLLARDSPVHARTGDE